MIELERCEWSQGHALLSEYHDTEWGVPLFDDKKLFEFLVLDAFQAGLNWRIMLQKRENFRKAFDDFNPEKIARYRKARVEKLLRDPGIIRNRLKVEATVSNARAYLAMQNKVGGFSEYIWQFVDGRPIVNRFKGSKEIPAQTKLSQTMSHDLKQRGFRFVGPTICYAFMQAAGLVNDHLVKCFRYRHVMR